MLSSQGRKLPYVHRVELVPPAGGIPVDLTYALRAAAFDTSGLPIAVHAARFRSLDDSIAVVEGNVLRPRRVGVARNEVTLGGWRNDTGTVEIVPSSVREVLAERWGAGWAERWRPLGDPRPFVGSGDGGATLRASPSWRTGTIPPGTPRCRNGRRARSASAAKGAAHS